MGPFGFQLLSVQPDVGIGLAAPQETLADLFGQLLGVRMHGILDRRCRAHGVAHHITAGSHGAQAAVAYIRNDFLQTAFKYAVELNALTVGQAHVAEGFGA